MSITSMEHKKVIWYEETDDCTCLSKTEKRKALLLCCSRIETPCPVHGPEESMESAKTCQSLTVLERLRRIWKRLFKQKKENSENEEKEDATDRGDKACEADKELESETVKEREKAYYTEDDLLEVVRSMMACDKRKCEQKRNRRRRNQIMIKYAKYDQNRERIHL